MEYSEYIDNLSLSDIKNIIGSDYDSELRELAEEWFLDDVQDKYAREFIKYFIGDTESIESFIDDAPTDIYKKFNEELKDRLLENYEDDIREDYEDGISEEENEASLQREWEMSRGE